MTGEAENDMRQSMEKGADDYLFKPFEPETLITAVKSRLNRREEIDQNARDVQARLFAIVSCAANLVAIVDRDTQRAVYLNLAGRTMLGLDPSEDIAQLKLKECFPSGKRGPEFEDYIKQAEANGTWSGECRMEGRHKKCFPVELQLLAHRSEEGRVTWLSIIANDLTETIQLRQAQKMEAIGRLAAGIAHEINTPTQYVGDNTKFLKDSFQGMSNVLAAHRALSEAVRTGAATDELIRNIERVEAESDLAYLLEQIPCAIEETLEGVGRVSRIVGAMKEFSHPGKSEKCPTDLNRAIETTATVARNEWRYVADLTLDLDSRLPLVPCFAGEFNQVILNLVVNAAHAIGDVIRGKVTEKGTIAIRTRRDGEVVELRVSDTGSGIPEAVQPRIFEPFFTTKPVGQGTGQGLAFVYTTIVKKHGGSVRFETEPGKGTTFILRLPVVSRGANGE
jgi:signal transduction histidine kinase